MNSGESCKTSMYIGGGSYLILVRVIHARPFSMQKSSTQTLRYDPPVPLLLGRITFDLDPAAGLNRTRQNFLSLCTGDKGFCKSAPNKKLHYLGCPIHRVVRGFVAQGGDVVRYDGSGGEVSV